MGVSSRRERKMQADSSKAPTYRTIQASEFKEKCLNLMDEVAESGGEIVIIKNGRPVSRLIPYRERTLGRAFVTHGDIVEPMPAEWFEDDNDSEEGLF